VVNLKYLQLIVFRDLVAGRYGTELTLTVGAISPTAFPDIQIDVRQMFNV
jgi:hypothetical protein